jgi:DNA polymerase-3 subunit beta
MFVTLSRKALKAASICAAKKDIRYYLNGVNIQFVSGPDSWHAVYAGTDGYILLVGKHVIMEGNLNGLPPAELIIPLDVVKTAVKGKGHDGIVLKYQDEGRYTLGDINFTPIDGKFPDFHRVIPNTLSGETGQFNADLLSQGTEALRAWFDNSKLMVGLRHNGRSAGIMGNWEEVTVAVMPMHCEMAEYKPFEFPKAKQEKKAA